MIGPRNCNSIWLLAILALLAIGVVAFPRTTLHDDASHFVWSQAVPAGQGNWPRWNMPVVAFDGQLWAVQDRSAAWSSRDAINWQRHDSNAGWGERYLASVVFFQNKLWVLGGRSGPVPQSTYWNDVWTSANGTEWRREAQSAEWSPRWDFTARVFKNKLWIFGGRGAVRAHDAWSSDDGVHWKQVLTELPWQVDAASAVIPLRDELWCISFGDTPQLWRSSDGIRWTSTPIAALWKKMMHRDVFVFGARLWMIGGADFNGDFYNDVWTSDDGVRWQLVTEHAPWWPRATNYSVVFNGQILIYGGKNSKDDVWRLSPR